MGAADGRLAVMVGGERAATSGSSRCSPRWAGADRAHGSGGRGHADQTRPQPVDLRRIRGSAEASRLAEAAGVDIGKLAAVVRHSDAITGGAECRHGPTDHRRARG